MDENNVNDIEVEDIDSSELEDINLQELNNTVVKTETTVEPTLPGSTKNDIKQDISENVKKSAQYYMRNPDMYTQLTDYIDILRDKDPSYKALKEVSSLRLDNARKDVIIEFRLNSNDMKFVHGNNPEELKENAKLFAEYKSSLGKLSQEDNNDSATSFNNLPKYTKSSKDKMTDLEQWFHQNDEVKI